MRGICYEKINNWKSAEEDLLKSLDINPESSQVLNYLAYSWIEQGVKIEKSLNMLEKANKIKVWDTLVKTYEEDKVIDGVVIAKAKGGLTVDIGLKAFLPGSQIDLRPTRNLEKLIGEEVKMKIIKMKFQYLVHQEQELILFPLD